MRKLKIKDVIMVISAILCVVMIGHIVVMSEIDKQTDHTTTFFSATISDIDITDTGGGIFVEIYTEEYDTSLLISTNISKNIEMDDVRALKKGQTVYFRIENIKAEQMNHVEFLNILSLKTEENEIFSLPEYNEYIRNSARSTRVASIVIAILSLFVSLGCYLQIKRENMV